MNKNLDNLEGEEYLKALSEMFVDFAKMMGCTEEEIKNSTNFKGKIKD